MKLCPYCAEQIQDAAIICRFCQRDLATGAAPPRAIAIDRTWKPGVAAVLSLVIPGAGQLYKGDVGAGIAWLIGVVLAYFLFLPLGLLLHLICVITAASSGAPPPAKTVVAPPAAPPPTPEELAALAAAERATRRIVYRWLLILGGIFVFIIAGLLLVQYQMAPRERGYTVWQTQGAYRVVIVRQTRATDRAYLLQVADDLYRQGRTDELHVLFWTDVLKAPLIIPIPQDKAKYQIAQVDYTRAKRQPEIVALNGHHFTN